MVNPEEPYKKTPSKVPATLSTCPKKTAFIDELVKKTEPKNEEEPKGQKQ